MQSSRAGPGKRGSYFSSTDCRCVLQLQDAFSRGLLKPGLNVVLEGPKKTVNDLVSAGAGQLVLGNGMRTRQCYAWRPILVPGRRNLCKAKRVDYLSGYLGVPLFLLGFYPVRERDKLMLFL